METIDFLKSILPAEGEYYVAYQKGSAQLRQAKTTSIDEAHKLIEDYKSRKANVYVATGSFVPGTSRKGAHVLKKACFYYDIDSGPDKPYLTKREALEAFKIFHKTVGTPTPSFITDTGHGFHIWWVLDTAVGADEWRSVALGMEQLAIRSGLEIDPITKDASRILRVPGTTNWKDESAPVPCRFLVANGKKHSIDVFRALVPRESNVVPIAGVTLPGNLLGADLGTTGGERAPRHAVHIMEECGVLQQGRDTGGRHDDYNQWWAKLHLLAYCEDGEEYAHIVGQNYPSYDAAQTQQKFEERKGEIEAGTAYGATTCERFHALHPEICEACPHWNDSARGQTWSSPLHFGLPKPTETMPWPYMALTRHGKKFTVKPERNEEGELEYPIVLNGVIEEFRVLVVGRTTLYAFVHSMNAGDKAHVVIDASVFASYDTMERTLVAFNIPVFHQQRAEWKMLVRAWHDQLRNARKIVTYPSGMGWVRGPTPGFRIGPETYWPDGSTLGTPVGDQGFDKRYVPMGELGRWQTMVKAALQAEHVETNVLIATAFGAPVINLLPVEGAMISAVSRASGTGKTVGIKLAQAVWGDPMAMFALSDTPASMFKRLGMLGNLPAYWDEVRISADRREKRQHVNLLYQTTLGREKARMKQNTDLHELASWETLIVCTSNEGIREHVKDIDHGMTAGMNRVLEFNVRPLDEAKRCRSTAFSDINNHYGYAGIAYAQWITKHRKQCEKEAEATLHKLEQALGASAEQRYLVAAITAVYLGAKWAKAAAIIDLDPGACLKFLLAAYQEHGELLAETNESNANSEYSPVQIVANFLSQNQRRTAVIKERFKRGGTPPTDMNILRGVDGSQETVAVVSMDGELVIPCKVLDEYMRARDVTSPRALMKNAMPATITAQRQFPKLLPGDACGRVWCYVIDRISTTTALFPSIDES